MRYRLLTTLAATCLVALAGTAQGAVVKFSSPSGNIDCIGDNAGGKYNSVRCDVAVHTWTPPAKPSWCTVDYGQGVALGRRSRATYVCAGDTALGAYPVLAYGHSRRIGGISCLSTRTGMRCRNVAGFGFKVSKQAVRFFRVILAS